jgi:homoserine dehydrogenase
MERVAVGLLGLGTVGSGVVRLLSAHGGLVARRAGRPIDVQWAVVRDPAKPRNCPLPGVRLLTDARRALEDPEVQIVVETMGGIEPTLRIVLEALAAGKDVVTANKALLAEHGEEIFRAAGKAGLAVGFEASVGGGVPIIRTLREALAGDRQRTVYGIVNGTCNSILSTMSERGTEFAEALAEAQRLGLAEADAALDIEGHDAAHKLCLLVTLAFGVLLKPAQVYTEGIRHVTQGDITYARELGYAIKLLAIAKDDDGAIEARVHPTMIPMRHLLAVVSGAFNAIYIHGEALGSTMYFGAGAGQMPTATAVMADILEIARHRVAGAGARAHALGYPVAWIKRARVKPMDDVICEYYLRFIARDEPGVLGAIASVLGRNQISIASVIQQGRGVETTVPVIMRTHEARERDLKRALGAIRRLRMVKAAPAFIRIEERL